MHKCIQLSTFLLMEYFDGITQIETVDELSSAQEFTGGRLLTSRDNYI